MSGKRKSTPRSRELHRSLLRGRNVRLRQDEEDEAVREQKGGRRDDDTAEDDDEAAIRIPPLEPDADCYLADGTPLQGPSHDEQETVVSGSYLDSTHHQDDVIQTCGSTGSNEPTSTAGWAEKPEVPGTQTVLVDSLDPEKAHCAEVLKVPESLKAKETRGPAAVEIKTALPADEIRRAPYLLDQEAGLTNTTGPETPGLSISGFTEPDEVEPNDSQNLEPANHGQFQNSRGNKRGDNGESSRLFESEALSFMSASEQIENKSCLETRDPAGPDSEKTVNPDRAGSRKSKNPSRLKRPRPDDFSDTETGSTCVDLAGGQAREEKARSAERRRGEEESTVDKEVPKLPPPSTDCLPSKSPHDFRGATSLAARGAPMYPFHSGPQGSAAEACQHVQQFTSSGSAPPPPPSSPLGLPDSPTHATSALTKGLHPAFIMHSNRAYLPSPRMYSAVVPGIPSPTLPPSSAAAAASLRGSDQGQTSPAYDSYRDGGGTANGGGGGGGGGGDRANNVAAALVQAYSRSSQSAESAKAQTAATLAYAARLQQEGFPYGISGVPHMPSYNYGSELYNYVSNGFPRKSRICSYCSKVFTRSTTRRYHEKRCPLLRAAGSLMKGSGAPMPPIPNSNGPADKSPGDAPPNGGMVMTSRPPPLISVSREGDRSPASPPSTPVDTLTTSSTSYDDSSAASCNNNASNANNDNINSGITSSTSVGLPSMTRPHDMLNSPFYGGHRPPQAAPSTISTSTATHLACAAASSVDLNRNSVLSAAVKQEAHFSDAAADIHAEHDLLRNHQHNKLGSRGGGGGGGGGEIGGQGQQPMFSPLSAASRSPSGSRSRSEEEEGESEDGGEAVLKAPPGASVKAESDMYNDPALHKYYLAKLAAMQAVRAGIPPPTPEPDAASFVPPPYLAASSPTLKVSRAEASIHNARYASPSDKDEESLRDGDSSCREEDDSFKAMEVDDDDGDDAEEGKKCGICAEEFRGVAGLRVHERVHQKYKPNACRFCGQRFIKPSMRIAHQRLHAGKYSLGCVVCGLHMLTRFGLRQHIHREHYSPAAAASETPCRYCEATVDGVYDLRRHFHSHRHQVPRSERESIRYLRSPLTARSLSPAEEEASQELPPPSIDSKASQDSPVELGPSSDLPPLLGPILPPAKPGAVDEERMNGGGKSGSREKEWCRICEKDYPKSFMRYHEREHADQKPYECSLCKKRFGYKNNMKSHMKLHAGIKPYQCSICMAKFTRGSTLRRHARRHGVNSDSVWDLFVKKDRALLLNQAARDAALAGPKAQSQGSPPTPGSRALKADPALLASLGKGGEGKGYDLRGYSPSSAVPQTLYNAYSSFPSNVTQAMLQPYMAAQQYLGYAAGFPSAATAAAAAAAPAPPPIPSQQQQQQQQPPPPPPPPQAVQSDALDFSMPDKQRRRNSSSSSTSAQRPASAASLSAYPGSATLDRSPGYPPASSAGSEGGRSLPSHLDAHHLELMEAEGEAVSRGNGYHSSSDLYPQHSAGRPSLNETVESYLESGGHQGSLHQHHSQPQQQHQHQHQHHHGHNFHQYDAQDFGTQVTLCCAHPPKDSDARNLTRQVRHGCSPLDMSSPAKASRLEGIQHESIANLMSAGRLFRCPHCDCYFTDYTMYLLHQKIHLPDQPFVCFLCQEDCHDKMSFSQHLLDHLR